jgi:tellurite resistance protein TerC
MMVFGWLIVIVQLIFLEGILSVDNAAILGVMVASLPDDQPAPWPSWLSALGRFLDAVLGSQRRAALKVGLLGAYGGRAAMLLAAHFIVQQRWFQFLGGVYLLYLAASHLAQPAGSTVVEATTADPAPAGQTFWRTVLVIEITDLIFSLDNIMAAVALSPHILVLMTGVAMGMLAMRVAAGLFNRLVAREPVLETAAYVLLLAIGMRFIGELVFMAEAPMLVQFGLPVAIVTFALLYAHWPRLHVLRPFFGFCQEVMQVSLGLFRRMVIQPVVVLFSLAAVLWRGS